MAKNFEIFEIIKFRFWTKVSARTLPKLSGQFYIFLSKQRFLAAFLGVDFGTFRYIFNFDEHGKMMVQNSHIEFL